MRITFIDDDFVIRVHRDVSEIMIERGESNRLIIRHAGEFPNALRVEHEGLVELDGHPMSVYSLPSIKEES